MLSTLHLNGVFWWCSRKLVSETVGQFTLALAICAPIVMFTNLQLRAIQATDANELYEFGHYLSLRLVMSTLALVTITMVAVASSYGPVIVLTVGAIACKGF